MAMPEYLPRMVAPRLLEALADSPVILIHGPRQCGKTTLAQMVCAPHHLPRNRRPAPVNPSQSEAPATPSYEYITLDDSVALHAAQSDPAGFVDNLPARVVLDEVQRVPELFQRIKIVVDRQRLPGTFVLTGSANVMMMPTLSESLAGRVEVVRLHPLAQRELRALPTPAHPTGPDHQPGADPGDGFLDRLFSAGFGLTRSDRMVNDLAHAVVAGGYPAALDRPPGTRRANWYANYLDAIVQRDVRELARIEQLDSVPRLLEVAAAQTARMFNLNGLAAPFRLTRPTIGRYLSLLERLFLVERLPPWFDNRLKRLVKTPKLHLTDTGLACSLVGADAKHLIDDRALYGQMLETFAFTELRRQASWHRSPHAFFHFRDHDGAEVDIVIQRGRQVAGVEVKAGATVRSSDFKGLRKLASATGDRFAGGVVLYDGEITAGFGDRLYAVPFRRLWE